MGDMIKLSDLFQIGSSKRVLKAQWQKSGVPFYRGREITKLSQHGFVDNELFITEELYEEYADKYGVPTAEDIVITAIGTIGNSYVVQEEDRFYFKDASVLWLKKISDVDSKYINLWLKSPLMKDQLDEGNGATVDTLTIKKLQSLIVDLPPIPEQKRIVAILDQAFADIEQARAKTEQNLKNARELFESYLQQVFSQRGEGWELKAVSEIAETCLGKMLDKKKNKGSPKPYLRNLNVQWFDINTTDLLEMRFEDSEYERYAVKKGDLVICEGGYPGRAAIWENNEDIFFQKALHRIRCHDEVYNKWVLFYLYLSDCNGSLKRNFTGAGIQHFTGKALKQLQLPIPCVEEVEDYVRKFDDLLDQVKCLEGVYYKKLSAIDELKKSILQKAFSGELTKDENKGVAA